MKALVRNVYTKIYKGWLRFLSGMNATAATKMFYEKQIGRKLDLSKPYTLNEKVQKLKLTQYYNNPLITQCVDKCTVHQYLEKCGYLECAVPLLGVWDKAEDIDWDSLPEKFVLKCNHGCGYNIICTSKDTFDRKKAANTLTKWLKQKYWKEFVEVQYKFIKPQILCEKYIDFNNDRMPTDYKIHCFNGKPMFTLICTERDEQTKLNVVDNEYNIMDVVVKNNMHYGGQVAAKPLMFEKMLDIASKLSVPFPFVRIDFYATDDKIYVGEFTFVPQGGVIEYFTEEFLERMGELLDI